MIRSALRFGLRAIFLAGCIVGLVTVVRRRSSTLTPDDGPDPWASQRPVAVPPPAAWVEPQGKACPPTHPVKAKQSSNIFHVPGGVNYDRTQADRCYVDEDAALRDGLRRSKV